MGWVEIPGTFKDDDARQAAKSKWQQDHSGPNRGKVAFLDKGMKFHEIGMSNADSQFVESRRDKISEIARIFRVPPHMIGDLTRSTNNNIEHQGIEFWTGTMLPIAELWESSIEFSLLGPDSDFEVEFDMRRLMRGDAASRSAYYQGGINSGWLTRNEAREEEGLDPLDGLDEPLRPLNMAGANTTASAAAKPIDTTRSKD
jgi:HK97 family phage portal protein